MLGQASFSSAGSSAEKPFAPPGAHGHALACCVKPTLCHLLPPSLELATDCRKQAGLAFLYLDD